ncbi:MAG: hypothetical protein ABIQ35_15225 [Verrucomicrobiota bacterium]
MQPEPKHKMEESLQRLAKERREKGGADFELHPATRLILQSEVARTFSHAPADAPRSFFLWPRLALMGLFTALLALTLTVLNQPNKSKPVFELSARREQPAAPALEPAPQNSPASPPGIDLSAKQKSASLEKRESFVGKSSPALADELKETRDAEFLRFARPQPSAPTVVELKDKNLGRNREITSDKSSAVTDAESLAAADRAPEPVAATATSTVQKPGDASAPGRRKFAQPDSRARFRQNLLSPPPSKILQLFEVARAGNKIQLYDSDGSIYEGTITPVPAQAADQKKFGIAIAAVSNFTFQATGTNRALRRLVRVQGNFALTKTGPQLSGNEALHLDGFATNTRSNGVISSSEINSGSIQGKVSIGGTNEFEFQATELPH